MDRRTIYIIVAVVVVLAIIGWSQGWFGGTAPEPVAPAAPTTAPAPTPTPAPAPAPAPAPTTGG